MDIILLLYNTLTQMLTLLVLTFIYISEKMYLYDIYPWIVINFQKINFHHSQINTHTHTHTHTHAHTYLILRCNNF